MDLFEILKSAHIDESTYLIRCIVTFFVSMIPIIELRGAIPAGVLLGLPGHVSMLLSIIGNILPVPFIIIFVRRVFGWMRKRNARLGSLADGFERKAKSKGEKLYRGELIGLLIFVAVPLPGTGAWTGALIAAILNMRIKTALPAIAAGVTIAGILVTGITYGFKTLIA